MQAMVRSIPMYYEKYGSGIPLLMLHGWTGDHRSMIFCMEPLFQNRSGWRRIYPDLPGRGETPAAERINGQDHILEIVTEFMQTIAPNQRFVVGGYSYGGYLSQSLVDKQGAKIDGVFMFATGGEMGPTKQQLPLHQVLHEDAQFLAALTPEESFLTNIFVVQNMENLENVRTVVLPAIAAANHAFLNKFLENPGFSFLVTPLTIPFAAPTLILTGRQDSVVGYREAWALLDNYPRATFAVLDQAGHGLYIEQKALFRSLVSEWLNRVEEYIAQTSA